MVSRKRFSQLLSNPQTSRVLGDIEVQDASTIMRDPEEAIQHTIAERWNREEVHRPWSTLTADFSSAVDQTACGCIGFSFIARLAQDVAILVGDDPGEFV